MAQAVEVQKRADYDDVVRAIREVMENLEGRAARAGALEGVVWMMVVMTTFLFYQFVWWNPTLFWELFGPFLAFAWMVPVSAGWLAHEVLAPQSEGMADEDRFRGGIVGKAVMVVSVVLIGPAVGLVQFFGSTGQTPGVILLLVAVMSATERPPGHGSGLIRASGAVVAAVTGMLLVLFPLDSAFILAAVAYGAGIGGFAVVDYMKSR